MHFYHLLVQGPPKDKVPSKAILEFSTHFQFNGKPAYVPDGNFPNPNYMSIQFESTIIGGTVLNAAHIKIMGIDAQKLSQAHKLRYGTVNLIAGMAKGLPLSVPRQGLVFKGTIQEAIGNWTGTDMSLELFCLPGTGLDLVQTGKLVSFSKKGTLLSDAIKNALKGFNVDTSLIPSGLKCKDDLAFSVKTLPEFINQIETATKSWGMEKNYITAIVRPGALIRFQQFGNSQSLPVTKIQFQDLIGQPSYNGVVGTGGGQAPDGWTVSITVPMRPDIACGDIIELPSEVAGNNLYGIQKNAPALGNKNVNASLFAGKWQVMVVRHVGDSRNPDASQWSTMFGLYPVSDSNA